MKPMKAKDKKINGNGHSDVREAEVIDGETGKVDPSPLASKLLGRGDLSNMRDVRLAISKVIRAEVTGDVEHNRARGLVWMLRQLGDVIEVAELERRLRELEDRQGGGGSYPALPRPTLN